MAAHSNKDLCSDFVYLTSLYLGMKSGIYRITHTATGMGYIGSTGDRKKRWTEHLRRLRVGNHHARRLQYAWNKHGEAAFVFEVLELVDDLAKLIEREQAWIDQLQACKLGYNASPTAGSPRGFKHTAETKAKVSAAGKGRKLSPGHRAIISAGARARGVAHLHIPEIRAIVGKLLRGRPRPEAVKRHLSKLRTGMKFPPEWRAAISAATLGKKHGPMPMETRAKLSVAHTGKCHTPATRVKLSAAAKLRGAPKLTREAIDRGAAKRTGAKRTPEQKERIRSGQLRAGHPQLGTKHTPERIAKRVATRARNKALKQIEQRLAA